MSGNKQTKFLVVDDFDPMRKTVQRNLQAMGYVNIVLASNGREAINILEKTQVDCVISDWNMPVMNGFELLQYVRQSEQFKNLHFMLVTAESNRNSIEQAITEGVSNFLVKPFTQAVLRSKITTMLSRPAVSLQPQGDGGGEEGESLISNKSSQDLSLSRVLVVDDVPVNIDVIVGFLKDEYIVNATTNGEKALEIINGAQKPDLILLDIMMPKMDGIEVCRRVKSNPETQHIPIIFLTAKVEESDMVTGLEVGAADYITKPVSAMILKARVKTQLQIKQSRDYLSDEIDTLMENARLREDVELISRHDLKSPLTAVINNAESLLESKYIGGEQKLEIETMRDASYDMLGMINRSLDLYKMETGTYKVETSPIDIAQTALKVSNDARIYAQQLDVTIHYDAPDPTVFMGDELLCFSMLSNLLRNAVEASPSDEKIELAVSTKDENILITIHNQGVIPKEIRDTFFEKYSTFNKKGGTGLGTYSARLMVTVQGGDISYTTSEELGTTVNISLPKE